MSEKQIKKRNHKAWALFYGEERMSRWHSTELAAQMEAYDRQLVVQDKFGKYLANGYEVKHA